MKTSMVFECVKRDAAFYSRADRQHLFTWRMPPPDTLIWIGRYEEGHYPAIEKHHLAKPKWIFLGDGTATTFAIGHLAIQSFTARRSTMGEDKTFTVETGKGPWDHQLIQIWPMGADYVRWPPSVSITSERAKQLPKRFWAG